MRYIKKSDKEPACLSEYKQECKELGASEPFLYKGFNKTGRLKQILCLEQHNVCCYCQRPVKGFRIEHSYPENGPDKAMSQNLQLDYSNLFASCIDSQGYSKPLQYCDVAKGNQTIREFIKEPQCQTHFRYLSTGEIIPNGSFHTLKEYEDATALTPDEAEALHAIQILNLNCPTLREDRKVCLTSLLQVLGKKTKDEWQQTIKDWFSSETYPSFIELRLQYLNLYLGK